MRHIAGYDRSQTLLLPESLDEYVGPENPVRFIEAFVDGLDLTAAGFARVTPKVTGRPGYAPTDLLKLYIYGYLNRVRSSRGLAPTASFAREAVLDRMQARLVKCPGILDRRRESVEHPFGTIKQWMNQGAFLMRGLEKVRGEFSLTALAYNLRRVLNLVAFTDLMAALTA